MSFPFPVSPSRINTLWACERKYVWEYILGLTSPNEPDSPTDIGDKMHKQLELWFTKSVPPDDTLPGLMAQALLTKWPPPSPDLVIEQHVQVVTANAWYHGYKDIGYEQDFTNTITKKVLKLRVVGDHKSTSDLKWAKTPEKLETDPQTIVYSGAEMAEYSVQEVLTRWGYVTRNRKPKTKMVQQIITEAQIEAGFDILDIAAMRIYELHALAGLPDGLDPLSLEPTIDSCFAYGKDCPHKKDRCTDLTPGKRLRALMAQQTLREKILAQKAAKEGALGPALEPTGDVKPASAGVKATSVDGKTGAKTEVEVKPVAAMTLKEKMAAKAAAKSAPAAEPAPKAEEKPAVVSPKPLKAKAGPKAAPGPEPAPDAVDPADEPDDEDLDALVAAELQAEAVKPNNAPGSILKNGETLKPGKYFRVRFTSGYEGLFGPIPKNIEESVMQILVGRSNVESITEQVH